MFLSGLLPEEIPQLETRRGLLILDLQNDFLSEDGNLPVNTSTGFVDNIKRLIPIFREAGEIIWVRTEFEEERLVNDEQGEGESVITDEEIAKKGEQDGDIVNHDKKQSTPSLLPAGESRPSLPTRPSLRAMDLMRRASARNQEELKDLGPSFLNDNETFLSTSKIGERPSCCISGTAGAEFADTVISDIDRSRDSVVVKAHYSALNPRSSPLLFSLRGKLVTELFICGSLSNISVYATALDAVRHGFSITILEDCLGYRNDARHEEAMRQMADFMGADGLTSAELIRDITGEQPEISRQAQTGQIQDDTIGQDNLNRPPSSRRSDYRASTPSSVSSSEPFPTMTDEQPTSSKSFSKRAPLDRLSQDAPKYSKHEIIEADTDWDAADDSTSQDFETSLKELRKRYGGAKTCRLKREDSDPDSCSTRMKSEESEFKEYVPYNALSAVPKIQASKDRETLASQTKYSPSTSTSVGGSRVLPVQPGEDGSVPANRRLRYHTAELKLPSTAGGNAGLISQAKARSSSTRKEIKNPVVPELGAQDIIGEGDSRIIENFLPMPLIDDLFERCKYEVKWQTMSHKGGEVPRLVAVEGDIGPDGSKPIYRHPADESPPLLPFSPAVSTIKSLVQKTLGHPVNHVLIQMYRDGKDNISEHSDKTLDIVRRSSIANFSLGAQRIMTLRTKKPAPILRPSLSTGVEDDIPPFNGSRLQSANGSTPPQQQYSATATAADRHTQRVQLPHNSIFILGSETNKHWLHGVRPDKRPRSAKGDAETAYDGERISLTFRYIGTYTDEASQMIWGQGARCKTKAAGGKVIHSQTEANKVLRAFGKENQRSGFDWDAEYGEGFDVLDMTPAVSKLFLNDDPISAKRVKTILAEKGLSWESCRYPVFSHLTSKLPQDLLDVSNGPRQAIKYIDEEVDGVEVEGDFPILFYIEKFYPDAHTLSLPSTQHRAETALEFSRTPYTEAVFAAWRSIFSEPERYQHHHHRNHHRVPKGYDSLTELHAQLDKWESWLAEGNFVTGNNFSVADCAFWPVLDEIITLWSDWDDEEYPGLRQYYQRVRGRESVKIAMGED
ncbi:MAG: hypothetical protein M1827_003731 [Pycnora praestabilis]|nr:MAG: hypothetical protein M1827_003731 [Pycnora praestabilis]